MSAVRVKGGVRRNPRGRSPRLVLLREDFARGSKPLRVDREAGVIHGVKVVGLKSPNTHGVEGADAGTVYSRKALQEAARLYEGTPVNINHPDRAKPKQDRPSEDRFGKLQDIEVRDDGLYGDLHYLKSHPMAERVCEAAERMPDLFALSHNAYGRGEVREGRYVVSEIPEVRSVDLVADGGTNKSLFESQEHRPMKRNLKKLAESARKCKTRKAFARLLEMYEDEPEVGDGDAGGDEAGLDDHLGNAILAVMKAVKDGDMSPEEGRKKVLAAYKMSLSEDDGKEEGEGEEEERRTEEAEEDDGDGGRGTRDYGRVKRPGGGLEREDGEYDGEGDEDHPEDEDEYPGGGTGKESEEGDLEKPKRAQESRRRRRAPKRAVLLTEARAEALCDLAGVEPAEELLETLTSLDEHKAMKHLAYVKNLAGGRKPRTQLRESGNGHGGGWGGDVTRIRDGKSFAEALRNGLN